MKVNPKKLSFTKCQQNEMNMRSKAAAMSLIWILDTVKLVRSLPRKGRAA